MAISQCRRFICRVLGLGSIRLEFRWVLLGTHVHVSGYHCVKGDISHRQGAISHLLLTLSSAKSSAQ